MLERPGDLIPVKPAAATIPWTRRRSQILNFLHRGPVNFSTLVYDTNVGDISSLASYFNERISVDELNSRFGHNPLSVTNLVEEATKIGNENVVMPRLLLYPERMSVQSEENGFKVESEPLQNQARVQRTLDWVINQKLKRARKPLTSRSPGTLWSLPSSSPTPPSGAADGLLLALTSGLQSPSPTSTSKLQLPSPQISLRR